MRMRQNWTIRLATFFIWLVAAASGVYWALKFVQGTSTPANAAVVAPAPASGIDTAALAKGLGGGAPSSVAARPDAVVASSINASRFVLTGVVKGRSGGQSLALIAVDAKPAKPYRIGAQVADGMVLKSVENRQALLAASLQAPTAVTLDLPKQASVSVGLAQPIAPPPVVPAFTPPPSITPAPVPVGINPSPTSTPMGQASTPTAPDPANPASALGQNPARAGAIRQRAGKEGARQE
jgi:general secretion pathway protein C